ncbi:hypothetical protein HRR83_003528 [Exophiala dermatitidis]|uniref:Uncharacterized protein n=1 Tax=Exophiala dermatitidis TaxID=5970 RepID=A0AAN6EZ60_EXODE|nr:hypothetical protein HRR77_005260 [Exophiala dermatitidis]KAJ4543499.1 hypothetical protein HRR76_001568 [Exophiala dermatitidis]KAJ4574963.1 hypothetical protein HRR79_001898 [Exophiala dermatitidis]KAJ4598780.1 hypothetical protein HRR83_003528 [Exophiala dermatitidis]KAJ4610043.1 hypothetical protein HRR85_005824 [Exophiala dermatitidis]
MRALWYDVFKQGKTLADAPPDVLAQESNMAWSTNVSGKNTRFFNIITEKDDVIAGAVVHFTDIKSYDDLLELTGSIPWMEADFAVGRPFLYQNFVSVEKLFHQNGKYLGVEPIKRIQPFTTSPTVTWYAFRMLKGGIAEEVFDLLPPDDGLILRIKANDRAEVEEYLHNFLSVRHGAVDVLVLKTKSTCVWDFAFF